MMERVGEAVVVAALVGGAVALWMFRARPALLSRAGDLLTRLRRSPDVEGRVAARSSTASTMWRSGPLAVSSTSPRGRRCSTSRRWLEVWLILRTMPAGAHVSLADAFLMETAGRFITVAFKFIPYRLGVDELGSGSVSQLLGLGAPTGRRARPGPPRAHPPPERRRHRPARAGAVARHGSILSRAGWQSCHPPPPSRRLTACALRYTRPLEASRAYPTPALGATMERTMTSLKTLTTLAGYGGDCADGLDLLGSDHRGQSAPTVDPALYGGMRWRSVGPARGGRSITAGGSEPRPNEYWFGATGGGVWKTTDGGNNWEAMTDGKIATSSVGSLGVCQANPDVVYIGGGEVAVPRQHHPGRRRLQDHRRRQDVDAPAAASRLAGDRPHPRPPDQLRHRLRGGVRPVYNEHPERGVFKSTDGGQTFARRCSATRRRRRSISPSTRRTRSVLFAGLWEANRSPWGMSSGGPGSGLFKSTDGGDTWTELTKNPGLPAGPVGQGRRVGVAGGRQPRLRADRERRRAGSTSRDDARRDLEAGQREPQPAAARVLLHAPARRHEGQGHRLRPERAVLQVDRRRQDDHDHPRPARRQPRPVDLGHRQPAHGAGQRRRRQRLVNGGRTWTGPGLPDRAVLQRVHDQARAVSRLRRAAGQHHGVRREPGAGRAPARAACRRSSTPSAAARAATSRRTRPTSTCSTPAATAASSAGSIARPDSSGR